MSVERLVIALLVASAFVVGAVPGAVTADVEGEPNLEATMADDRVTPGEETTVDVTLVNRGEIDEADPQDPSLTERVKSARGLTVEMRDGNAPIEVQTGTQAVGTLGEGASSPIPFDISVEEGADSGTYRVPVTVDYTYTSSIDDSDGDETVRDRRETLYVTLTVEDDAHLTVHDVTTDARVGSTGSVNVTVENTGTATANGAELEVVSANSDLTFGGSTTASRSLGDWEPGENRTVEYTVSPGGATEPQDYSVDITARYRDEDGQPSESETETVALRPEPKQTFSVAATRSTVAVGDTGTLTVDVRNDGPIPVSEATVELTAASSALNFEGSASTSRFVGTWQQGETRTVEFDVTATEDADTRSYALDATVSYRDDDDDPETAPVRSLGLTPDPEQSFAIGNVSSTLAVGSEGTLNGTVTNTGDATVSNGVVQFVSETATVTALETDAPVGELAPGESASFSIPLEISESAEAGQKQYTLSVRYRNQDGDERVSDTVDVRQEVGPDDPEFSLSTNGTAITAGQTTQIEVTVTNDGNERLTDISANIFADDPISTVDDEAFISSLAPGESTVVKFSVSAGGGALAKDYPLSLDFQYDEPDGDTIVSDTYKEAISVEESDGGGGFPVVLLVVGVVLVIAAAVAYRRYR